MDPHPPALLPDLTVVIPTLNEAGHIGQLLVQLQQQTGLTLEVVVADGGSTDDTIAIVRRAGVLLVEAAPGRGRQLNAGRRAARSPLLLFLHADSRLTGNTQLAKAVTAFERARAMASTPVAGHFQLRFHDAQGDAFTYYEGLSALGRAQTINGDQGMLLERHWLDTLGGFHEVLPFLEDQDLSSRIFASGAWVLLPGRIETSARRFHVEGTTARSIHNAVTMAFFSFQYAPFFALDRVQYRCQADSRRLAVRPLAREIWTLLRQQPRILLPLARYTNRHAIWRAAFWLDVRRHGAQAVHHHPWLSRYTRWVAPWMHTRIGDIVWVIPTVVAYLAVWAWHARREVSPGALAPTESSHPTPISPRRADAGQSTCPSPSWTAGDSRPGSTETRSHH